jgi:hypothetical protein
MNSGNCICPGSGYSGEAPGHFLDLVDPSRSNQRYLLCDLIRLSVAAVMCGCHGWEQMADRAEDAFEFLEALVVKAEHGYPSVNTSRFFVWIILKKYSRIGDHRRG